MIESREKILRALLDCLIPPDDFPGAWEAGVGEYLARLFETDLASQLDLYCAGLDALELESSTRFNASFCDLTLDQQSTVVGSIELGELLTTWQVSPKQFLDLVINTTAEGYYCDPQQGGNRGASSWVMTGFEESLSS